MSIISLVVFIALQIAFIPLAVLGIILVVYRQMVVSKNPQKNYLVNSKKC